MSFILVENITYYVHTKVRTKLGCKQLTISLEIVDLTIGRRKTKKIYFLQYAYCSFYQCIRKVVKANLKKVEKMYLMPKQLQRVREPLW
jgi:hypothetical protein